MPSISCKFELHRISVLNRPGGWQGPAGGLPRAPDETGWHNVVRPPPRTRRTAIIMKDDEPQDVRQFQVGDGRCLRETGGGGRGWRGMAGGLPRALDGTGRPSVVRPGQSKCRTAVLGPDGGVLQGETCVFGVAGTAGDGQGL